MLPSVWGNKVLTSTGKALSNGSQGDSLPQGRPNYSPKLRGAVSVSYTHLTLPTNREV